MFEGDEEVPFHRAAHDRWLELGIARERIHRYGREHNWWGPAGAHGPCGPDSEIFWWTGDGEPIVEPALDDRWLEVWNNVFITWELTADGRVVPLSQRNVDTGVGLERLVSLLQGAESVYETDLLSPIMEAVERLADDGPLASRRIVCDHLRAATFLIDGSTLFGLFETHGLPPEMSIEELRRRGVDVGDWQTEFEQSQRRHQARSQAGSGQRFAGGLATRSDRAVRLHTATHLLGGALRRVLGDHVHQRGSNITDERLRFDFSHDTCLSDAELEQVSEIVNQAIDDDLPVEMHSMSRDEADRLGAEREFGHRYPDIVSVYTIGDLSAELCGGPHVARTSEVGRFRILKQESSGAGVRRIRATVE